MQSPRFHYFKPVGCNQLRPWMTFCAVLQKEFYWDFSFSILGHGIITDLGLLSVWDPPQVLFSGHGTEATDMAVKAREKRAVKLFATCQLCSVEGRWIVWFSFIFSLNLVHSVLWNVAVSNHRNPLARCVVSRDISDVFSRLTGIFTFNGIIMILARP